MKSNYKRLGDYISPVKVRNSELKAKELLGININKFFMPSVANIVGTDLSKYKLVQKNQFACNRMHVGRDYRIPIAVSKSEEPFMVSPAYDVFEIVNTNELLPEYLMMWFERAEFDRNAWFYTDADVRGGLAWQAFVDMQLPVPHITKQREIVAEYNTVQNRIKLNEQLIQKLEETAQAIYKQWFIEFEFPPPSPPMEGCPQDGVVRMPDQPEMSKQDGVVRMPDQPEMSKQDGRGRMPYQPEQQDTPKLKRNSKNYFSLPYNPALRQRARELRKAGNLAEVLFWRQVRNKSFKGLDFDRQKIIGNYIVDFYCPNCQVVVEIDGASHNDKQEYDAKRDEYLKSIGLTVFHFTDYEVKENIDAVMNFLDKHPALNVETLADSKNLHSGNIDGEDKTNRQFALGVNAAGSFDHPVLRTPLQRRGSSQGGYKSSGGKMVWNEELGKEIPEGWRVKPISDVGDIKAGGDKPNVFSKTKTSTCPIPIYSNGTTNDGLYGYTNKNNYPKNSITISARGTIGFCVLRREDFDAIVRLLVLIPEYPTSAIYLWQTIKQIEFDNSGSVQNQLTIPQIGVVDILFPKIEILNKYDSIVSLIYQNVDLVYLENQKLTELKELLLSKLATVE